MTGPSKNLLVLLPLLASILVTGCSLHPRLDRETSPDGRGGKKLIVAVVNSVPITMDALVRTMNRTKVPGHWEAADDHANAVKELALDRLILQELAFQRAGVLGMTVERSSVDVFIASLREQLGGDKEFAAFLEKEGLTAAGLERQVERSLLLEKVFEREVKSRAVETEEELRQAFEQERKGLIVPEELTLVDVLIFTKNGRGKALLKAAELRQKIAGSGDRDPWKLVLDGSFSVQGLDVRKAPPRYRTLFDAARKMQPGELSEVLTAEDGLHIVKVTAYAQKREMTFDEARPALEARLKSELQQKRLAEWTRELKAEAEIVVREDVTVSRNEAAGKSENPN